MKTDKDPRAMRVRDIEDNEGIPLPYVSMGDLVTWLEWTATRRASAGFHVQSEERLDILRMLLALELQHAVETTLD